MGKVMMVNMETGEWTEFPGELKTLDWEEEQGMDLTKEFSATIEAKPLSALKMRWAFGIFPPGVPRRRIRRPEWRDL